MNYSLVLSPNAETDLAEGKLWYENKQLGLGEKFLQQVNLYFSKIQDYPKHFPVRRGNLSEAYIKKFPYLIIYQIIDKEIVIFSVFKTHQNPTKKP
ncbi:type II toxin-antitoxin system RelE/ParE family toxin [Chryseobacterium endophyticum]|uniref:Type II toxin-antitoxin system RelE/ParE family toxin n=1 Tax=Chryseobacterium endophyticum TaxID=1854762 RepID=A0AAU6WNS4_9FLAO